MTSFNLIQTSKFISIKDDKQKNSNFDFLQPQSNKPNSIFQQAGGQSFGSQFNKQNPNTQYDPFNFKGAESKNDNQLNSGDNSQQTDAAENSGLQQLLKGLVQMLGGGNKTTDSNQTQGTEAPASAAKTSATPTTAAANGTDKTDKKESAPGALISGQDHFEKFGKKEGRTFTSEEQYLKDYPDVKAAIARGKDPAADPKDINEEKYLAANPDVAKAVKEGTMPSGVEHYKQIGAYEGRFTSPEEYQKYLKEAAPAPAAQTPNAAADTEPAKTPANTASTIENTTEFWAKLNYKQTTTTAK